MSRKSARELAFHMIFEMDFTQDSMADIYARRIDADVFDTLKNECDIYTVMPTTAEKTYIVRVVNGISSHLTELDTYIERYSVGWKFGRLSRTVACILRLAMFEVLYMQDIPNSVSINEAVELAKKYDTPEAAAFINGILGSFSRQEVPIV